MRDKLNLRENKENERYDFLKSSSESSDLERKKQRETILTAYN